MRKAIAIAVVLGLLGTALAAPAASAGHSDHRCDAAEPEVEFATECWNLFCAALFEHNGPPAQCNDL